MGTHLQESCAADLPKTAPAANHCNLGGALRQQDGSLGFSRRALITQVKDDRKGQ
jgi:hypothetical protein